MKTSEKILIDRTRTSFGVSIGTGLALETLFEPTEARYDETRVIEKKYTPDSFTKIYFNVYTLLRNIISAISSTEEKKEFLNSANKSSILSGELITEYSIIEMLFTGLKVKPELFIPDYSLNKNLEETRNLLISSNVETTVGYTQEVIEEAVKEIKKIYKPEKSFKLKQEKGKYLILSHFPIDMLNSKNIDLSLLESHTGKVKTKYMMSSKFHKIAKVDFNIIPFTERLYYIFGDSSLLKPLDSKIRREIYDIAVKDKWTNMSTSERVKVSLMKFPEIYKVYNNFTLVY